MPARRASSAWASPAARRASWIIVASSRSMAQSSRPVGARFNALTSRVRVRMSVMANGGRGVEPYYERGMLEIRSTLHLAMRLVVRLNQLLQRSGAASPGTGLWRAALPAFVALDVAEWHALRRTDRFGLSWRLPLDAFDAAFWAASPKPASGHYDWALLIAIPLGIEAGVRLGWTGLVVPPSLLA